MKARCMPIFSLVFCLYCCNVQKYPDNLDISTLTSIELEDTGKIWAYEKGQGYLIDIEGKVIREMEYYPFELGVGKYRTDSMFGLVKARNGELITPADYRRIEFYPDIDAQWSPIPESSRRMQSDGLAMVESYKGFGVINLDGDIILSPVWKEVSWFSEGLCLCVDYDDNMFFYNIKGDLEFKVEGKLRRRASTVWFENGLVIVPLDTKEVVCLGKKGEIIYRKKLDTVSSNNYFVSGYVILDGLLIDRKGNIVYDKMDVVGFDEENKQIVTSDWYEKKDLGPGAELSYFRVGLDGNIVEGPKKLEDIRLFPEGLTYNDYWANYFLGSDIKLWPEENNNGVGYFHTKLQGDISYRIYYKEGILTSLETPSKIHGFLSGLRLSGGGTSLIKADPQSNDLITNESGYLAYSIVTKDGKVIWRNNIAERYGLE